MRTFIFAVALIGLALPAVADDAALLIGVSRYDDLGRVSSGSDLLRADDALEDAGYDVRTSQDGSGRDMARVLGRFAADAQDAARLVVGLSGQFVTDGDRSWYLAADARRPTLFNMGDAAISLGSVMAVLANAPGQAVLVLGLDESDDDAFDDYLREGLAELVVPQGVTVIIGGTNYVDDVLVDAVAIPGADVIDYVASTRRLRVVGYQPARLILQADGDVPVNRPTTPRIDVDVSLPFWRDAEEADNEDAYRDFILRFPQSSFAAEARSRLDAIENDPVRLDQRAEEQLNLTRNQRREIQRNLTLLEFNTRGVDGIFGPGSRGAIRNWQQSNGFTQTSFLTREQINRIDAQASRRQAEVEAEEDRVRQETLRLDRAYWEETGARGGAAGYRAYLERYPEGNFAQEARSKLDELNNRQRNQQNQQRNQQNNDALRTEQALQINPILARLIESRLAQLGFDPGNVDGRFNRDTRRAISRYQSNRNLPSTGYISEPTLARLLADTFR